MIERVMLKATRLRRNRGATSKAIPGASEGGDGGGQNRRS
jgi:hypothetical protein